ncbi:PhzF family phenazine biosynthesis protein [Photobacterium sanctipauli]|uniref:PhzF family phenazine biosynthesis protein n=1 Tax=Photobacterium sanctipauli TaxID=1342794 RepID=A0A2T3P009_9GAMM|nr:PhzF family phenazine biosynthesis protein [Photobacterium sanctipauli]PSW21799.1 PhzF family phenazine biosynthesis protein [Photobacterium sanctipauli]
MELEIFVIDTFTQQQFKGNSAAVVPLKEWLAPSLMQKIASENNLSETAFIKQTELGKYEIRWFSPLTEIDFCGHATLASSFVLFNHLGYQGEIEFSTLEVGTLTVNQLEDGRIEMSFPNQCPEPVAELPSPLLEGLSIKPVQVLKNRQAYFAVMASEHEVLDVRYQSEQLKQLAPFDVVVTAKSEEYDFVSRYFWPASGGDEDPVTGSIHSGLAPYWSEKLNKTELIAYQASQRGGVLYCNLVEDRVVVSGFGVMYLHGKIFV